MSASPAMRDIRPRARATRSMGGPRQRDRKGPPRRWLRGVLLALALVLLGCALAFMVRSGVH